jgi:hypothetical protein
MARRGATALVLVSLGTMSLQAQTLGTPVYQAPYRAFQQAELGGMLSDPGPGIALEAAYRFGRGAYDIGLRAGILSADTDAGDEAWALVGVDVRFRIVDHTEDFPLDGALTAGFGAAIGDLTQAYLPVGLSLGRRLELESGVSFVPYVQPVLIPTFGHDDDVLVSLGLGVDVKVSRSLDIRVSGGIGDLDGIAIGASWIR